MATPGRTLTVTAPADHLARLAAVQADVQAAGRLERIELRPARAAEPVHDVLL